jgi:hypothetical protein
MGSCWSATIRHDKAGLAAHKKSVAQSSVLREDMLSAGRRISQALLANHNLNIRRPISIDHLIAWRIYTVMGIVRGI